ncbi:MAG: HAD-IB family hydrolase [Litorivicinaceae bacterium]|nr:HAD-IB family hydrolase [Gammaproteobacteria bacterium]RPG21097.1 MAG: HAD-IB family hydrolase [Oceanospirillales bacterium TMED33]RZO77156.1 MAG: HAD-IB family hydrolase [Litorivicinaceae bacterium]CAI8352531.1 MAG: putative phosphatase [Gammaproteobacteria bacterium]|tara:strand:- start:1406 stop:2062 length:657 start_codon:yes stop_codon:yes gene_type:complete
MQLAVFDLDNTLLPFDSDKAWNQFLIDIGAVDKAYYHENNEQFYQDYLEAKLDIRAYQRFACEILQNYPIEKVTTWRDQYIEEIVRPQLQRKALQCIQGYKIGGFRTLIISATNTFIVEPIASLHGVDSYLGCEFEYIDGRYTGELTGIPTYKEGKIAALEAWLRSQGAEATTVHFYSDSINDRSLLEQADQAFVVDPDRSLAKLANDQGWPVVQFAD